MSELRLNRITGDWVIVASNRAKRPEEFIRQQEPRFLPDFLSTCPYCPGNEQFSETLVERADGAWKFRIVRNKFAALEPEAQKDLMTAGLKRWMGGAGYHEVVIESPKHNVWLWEQPAPAVASILEAMKKRYREMINDPRVELVVMFKNHGASAGTSLEHPHSQIVATPLMPTDVRRRLVDAIRFFDENSNCIFCMTLEEELNDQWRIIHQSPHFVSFVPFAALSPFHTLILPRHHSPDFGLTSDGEVDDLAAHLRLVLRKIHRGLQNPDLNFVIRSLPLRAADPRCFHWYMSIIPRVSHAAGFELGSGMFINATIPEQTAAFLRGIRSE
jgi:UDPglucose--hexose-1-phosphate uridylyltransferase